MRKLFIFTIMLLLLNGISWSQTTGGSVRTSLVLQYWSIETFDDLISEATVPIQVIYPVRENLNLQINHFPALSQFGTASMAGVSDTWIRTTYSFANDNAMASFGIGIPTGKTELDSMETILAKMLSQQSFKFQLPVYGTGLTLSGGGMYAYPVNDKFTVGGGVNFVYRGKYDYKYFPFYIKNYDPGDQIGLNLGLDYMINESFRSTADFVYNYYTADKADGEKIFASGPRIMIKLGGQYQSGDNIYWLSAIYQTKGKNQIMDMVTDKMEAEENNSNIIIRELHLGGKFMLNESASVSVIGEVRSYVENELHHDWVDLAGGGFIGEYMISETLSVFTGIKMYFGDGYFYHPDPAKINPTFSGLDFQLGSQWNF